jgi:hypothetical protein
MKLELLLERVELHKFFSDLEGLYRIGFRDELKKQGKTDEFIDFAGEYYGYSKDDSKKIFSPKYKKGTKERLEKRFPIEYSIKSVNLYKKWGDTGDKKYTEFMDYLMNTPIPMVFYNSNDNNGGYASHSAICINMYYDEHDTYWERDSENKLDKILQTHRSTLVHEITHHYQKFASDGKYHYDKRRAINDKGLIDALDKRYDDTIIDKDDVTYKGIRYVKVGFTWYRPTKNKHKDSDDDPSGYWKTDYEMDARFSDAVETDLIHRHTSDWNTFWDVIQKRVFGKHINDIPDHVKKYYKKRAAKVFGENEAVDKKPMGAVDIHTKQGEVIKAVEDQEFWDALVDYADGQTDKEELDKLIDRKIERAVHDFGNKIYYSSSPLSYDQQKTIKTNVTKKIRNELDEVIQDYMDAWDED